MEKVLYHQQGRQAVELLLIKRHTDGTADVGVQGEDKKPVVKIHGCRITDSPEFGAATLVNDPKAAALKEAAAKAKAASTVFVAAKKAADAKPGDEGLAKAAAEADAVLKAAVTALKDLEDES